MEKCQATSLVDLYHAYDVAKAALKENPDEKKLKTDADLAGVQCIVKVHLISKDVDKAAKEGMLDHNGSLYSEVRKVKEIMLRSHPSYAVCFDNRDVNFSEVVETKADEKVAGLCKNVLDLVKNKVARDHEQTLSWFRQKMRQAPANPSNVRASMHNMMSLMDDLFSKDPRNLSIEDGIEHFSGLTDRMKDHVERFGRKD